MNPNRAIRQLAKHLLPVRFHPVMFSLRRQWARSLKRQKELGAYATAVLTETKHGKLLVAASDMEVGRWLAHSGSYGLDAVEFHLRYLTPKSRILVVGTHVGALLVPLAKHVEWVVGIEANPETFRLLEMNVILNGIENAELHHLAAGDRNTEVDFLMRRCNTGGSEVLPDDIAVHDVRTLFDARQVVRVSQRRLDEVVRPHEFDLIIMDIEGAEYHALLGMPGILERSRCLQIEVIPHAVKAGPGATGTQFKELLSERFPLGQVLNPEKARGGTLPTRELLHRITAEERTGYDLMLHKTERLSKAPTRGAV